MHHVPISATLIWSQVLERFQRELSAPNFRTWFGTTQLLEEGDALVIIAPSAYIREVLLIRYLPAIQSYITEIAGRETHITIRVGETRKKRPIEGEPELFLALDPPASTKKSSLLRPDFTFDTLAVSTSNQLAHAAATAAVKTPGKAYNPLFIYGGVGVGKTHLMQAVGNAILSQYPSFRVVYCMGEEFTNELIASFQTKTTNMFKKKYRDVDCLLMDDIQFIAGKTTVQEEFFHTFNAVHRAGGQIVLTSDRPPIEIVPLEERLRSRFEAGMIVDIQPPGFELRTAILLIKATGRSILLPMDCAQFIAQKAPDIRKMEGMLTRFITVCALEGSPYRLAVAERLFGRQEQNILSRPVAPGMVVEGVARYYNVKVSQLKGVKRDRVIARPRQVIMYLLRKELRLPLAEVGRVLGGRDHTTILHGEETIEKLIQKDSTLAMDVSGIRKQLWG